MKPENTIQRRKYSRPSFESRLQLIKMVQRQGETIKNAARMLSIKESTAKLIVSRYRTCSTIYETKEEKKNRLTNQKRPKFKKIQKIEQNEIGDNIKLEPEDHKIFVSKEEDNQIIPNVEHIYPFEHSIHVQFWQPIVYYF